MRRAFLAPRTVVAAFVVAVIAMVASPVVAAIGVTPLSAVLPPGITGAAFTVTNPDTVERVVQPEVSRWTHVDGKDQLTKTSDWIVNPPIVSIPPLGSRVIRMALRHHVPATDEVTYRIVISEVNSRESTGVGVNVTTHLSLPVFIEPVVTSKRKPEWTAVRDAARQIVVTVKNSTPVHVHVMRFVLRDPSGKTLQTDAPSYVFAGESRSWTLVLDKSAPDPRSLIVEANTDDGVKTIPVTDR